MPARETPTHVDVFLDVSFKRLFDPEKQKTRLLSFLNSMLPDDEQVVEVEPLPNEAIGTRNDDRLSVLDLAVKTERGRRFLLEIQLAWQLHFYKRMLWYASRLISNELKGIRNWDYDILPVMVIGIVDFELEPGRKVCRYSLREEATGNEFPDRALVIQLVQLPAFRREPQPHANALEEWLYLTQNPTDVSFTPRHIEPDVAFKFLSETEFDRLSNSEQWEYLDAWRKANDDWLLRKSVTDAKAELTDAITELTDAKSELTDAKSELTETKSELAQITATLRQTARALSTAGNDVPTIASLMGLTEERVAELLD